MASLNSAVASKYASFSGKNIRGDRPSRWYPHLACRLYYAQPGAVGSPRGLFIVGADLAPAARLIQRTTGARTHQTGVDLKLARMASWGEEVGGSACIQSPFFFSPCSLWSVACGAEKADGRKSWGCCNVAVGFPAGRRVWVWFGGLE